MKWIVLLLVGALVVLAATVFSSVLVLHRHYEVPPPRTNRTRLPNLVPTILNAYLQNESFDEKHCAVVEKCTAPGKRRLLRFGLRVENRGLEPVFMGAPENSPESFVYSPCHKHYHFLGFSRYFLTDKDGIELAHGHKEAYCLRDNSKNKWQDAEATHTRERFTCEHQGISAGWADIYKSSLDCQWVDVTGLKSGRYRLVARINEERVLEESTYEDNDAWIWVEI